ncbi:alpha/beta-hydrolase [Neocallimastix sp. 'constans']|jgi:putative lipase involved disintegration of autophagic bodies
MFNKKIYNVLTIYILTLLCAIAIVYADNQDDDINNIITNLEYIPKKGYMINMKDLRNYNLDSIIKENDKSKTKEQLEKLSLFSTQSIKTPDIWLDEWNKTGKKVLYERYKNEMTVPNPKSNETVYQLLIMSRNAYVPPYADDWVDLTEYGWDILIPFGWSDDSNDRIAKMVRGYIFENVRNNILVVSIKGTSAGLFGIGGPTAENDRYNDNMMFSCCCAVVDRIWKGICGCHSGIFNVCELGCLRDESRNYKNSYFVQLQPILEFVEKYRIEKNYEVFFTGHSLGGSLASLSGLSEMAPVMTYEAPGEAQFARRIGLIKTELHEVEKYKEIYNNVPIYHFGNNGDPIFLGKCTGITSSCYYSGFAMETKCHVGKLYMFDLDKNISNPDDPDNPDDDDDPIDDDPIDDEPVGDNPIDDNPIDKNPINNDPENNNFENTKSYKYIPTKQKQRIFLNNKSSIYEHQLYMKRSQMMKEENEMDPSFTPPSNPSKLNMLHHRVDYVIDLVKKWEGVWPTEFYQDECRDCENWNFLEGDASEENIDEGRIQQP